jgi:lipopolysaccharide transport system permease protein
VRSRFSGSIFGLFWLGLHPLLFLGAYALVYLLIFKVRFQLFNSNEYVVLIFCGLIPFLGIAEALGTGVGAVTSNRALIKNTLFPIAMIPVKTVLVGQTTQLAGTALLLVTVLLVGHLTPWAFWLPVIWVLQLLFMCGLVWIISALAVFFRDLQYLMATLILLLMMISPIAYTPDMVPENMRILLWYNPLSHMIICYQDILMLHRFPEGHFWIFAAISLFSFYFGYFFFSRLQRLFADSI